ncbi:MAG: GNAT family N-acetyltransferase [Clostridiaceae bacterium]
MLIRRGRKEEVYDIVKIIKNAVLDMEAQGIYQWDDIYPNEEDINNDIYGNNLFVYIEDNIIKGIVVLNESQDKEYQNIKWKYNEPKNLVIHRLCIDPEYKGRGIATTLIKYAERFSKENGYISIRLDAFTENNNACRLYEKNGYEKRGIISFRKGEFFCLEKEMKKMGPDPCKNK